MASHDYRAYVQDLVRLLRESAEAACEDAKEEGAEALQSGRALAYVEVLSLMQSQADAFMIPREMLALDGFEPTSKLNGEP